MDVNIVKKIAEYIKVDLRGSFEVVGGLTYFCHVTFKDPLSNYYGWFVFDQTGSHYYGTCIYCLRPNCSLHVRSYNSTVRDNVKNYRNRFEFDDPISEA